MTLLVRCRSIILGVVAGLLSAVVIAENTEAGSGHEAPMATASVGRLWVPAVRYLDGYARHYEEQCSGTLISAKANAAESSLVISAWHCLEDYRDLSRPIVFEAPNGLRREARALVSGGNMDRDWALLKLSTPLPGPSQLARGQAQKVGLDDNVTMAGYPRREDRGEQKILQRRRCAITGVAGNDLESACALTVGASGGGVFSSAKKSMYLGVISRGDGESRSIFVPLSRFEGALRPYL